MKKCLFIASFFLLCGFSVFSQADTAVAFIKKYKGDITDFAVDQLENIYLINAAGQLKKIDARGDSVAVFNNLRNYGKPSFIDVSNPLRILLYYREFSTIVLLDRLLNIRSTIDLRRQDIFQAQAVCLSYDNKIWLYDEFEHKLKKMDDDGKLLFATADFRQLFGEAFTFSSIIDQDRQLYLYDKSKGAMLFDYYGAFKAKAAITGWSNFNVTGKTLNGIMHDSLMRYDPVTFRLQQAALPAAFRQAGHVVITATRLYALKENELTIYRLR
jgi:hypothetical protein